MSTDPKQEKKDRQTNKSGKDDTPALLRGDTLNYRSGVVAKEFLCCLFCHALFCCVLYRQIGKIYEGEHINFKNRHFACVASAIPQLRIRKKSP